MSQERVILFKIVTDQSGVSVGLKELREQVKLLNKDIVNRDGKNTPDQIERYTQELIKASIKIKDLTEQQRRLNKEFQAARVPKDSLVGLRLEYDRLINKIGKLNEAGRTSDFGKSLIKQAAQVKASISGIEAQVGRFTGNVGNYKSAFSGFGDALTGGLVTGGVVALLGGIVAIGKKAISINGEVSDSIANVAKAANISIPQVERLAAILEKRDTRTSLVEQLGIAEIGGKLGIATEQLQDFVENVDVVNVALGDEFNNDAKLVTDTLGKLRNVLLDLKSDNPAEDILHLGNALNFLEAQGAASASVIADFAGRIGGVASGLGASSGQILGISATLDELAVNAERGSTAVVRILQRMATAPEDFAGAINVPAKQFKDLVNKDIIGALQLFLGKLNDKKLSNTELVAVLNSLKLKGAGVSEVVGKLGGNLEKLNTRIDQSTDSLTNSNSVQQEFEKKNQTLGASLEKLSNSFSNFLTNSNFASGLASIINGLTDFLNSLGQVTDQLLDTHAATTGLTVANEILEKSFQDAATEIAKETVLTEKNFNILRNEKASREQRNQAIQDLLKLYPGVLTQQQLESAGIEQLNRLQLSLTDTLRNQVIERQKIRASEAITAEIIAKQLRQVELDATPDRAFVGQLSFGEVLRVGKDVGIIQQGEIPAARQSLKNQTNNDIRALEFKLQDIEHNFDLLKTDAESKLSAAEQDELDRRRQFGEVTGTVISKNKELGKSAEDAGTSIGKSGDKIKYAADSLSAFKKAVEDAKKALADSKQSGIKDAIKILAEAEARLTLLENRIAVLKTNSAINVRGAVINKDSIFGPNGEAPTDNPADANRPEDIPIGLTDDQLERAVENDERLIDHTEFTAEEILRLEKELSDKKIGLTAEELAARLKLEEEAEEKKKKLKKLAIDSAIQAGADIANAVTKIEEINLKEQTDAKLTALDEEYAQKIKAAEGNVELQAQLQEDLEDKKREIETEAAKERKELARKEAIINIALSIIKALTGAPPPTSFILAGAAAVAGAAELAVIEKTKYATGGFTGPGVGAPDETGRRVAGTKRIVWHENEYIAPTSQIQRMPALFNWLEDDRLNAARPFAQGGFTSTLVPNFPVRDNTPVPQFQESTATKGFTDDQIRALGAGMGSVIAQMVGAEVRRQMALGWKDANRRLDRDEQAQIDKKR